MKTIHPRNVSNEDLLKSLVANLKRDPSKDVSIITDELLRRLAAQHSVQRTATKPRKYYLTHHDDEIAKSGAV